MAKLGYAKISTGHGEDIRAPWPEMTALEVFNRLLSGMYEGHGHTTTERRLWALQVFRRQFSLRLPELLNECARLWPHWLQPCRGVHTIGHYFDRIAEVFTQLETSGRPAELDAWRPTARRSRNIVEDGDRLRRRFLDPGVYGRPAARTGRPRKPRADRCRVHADKPPVCDDLCSACRQRELKFLALDIITSRTPRGIVDKLLALPAVRGRRSTLIADARAVVTEYAQE